MKKNFVIDTNMLLENPRCIFGFDDNNVWITGTTLQELDKKKRTGDSEVRYYARECCRILDELRKKGDLKCGIDLENGGRIFVHTSGVKPEFLPAGYSLDVPDNRIISSCVCLKNEKPREQVILVTNDVSMRVNANICGVEVQEYFNDIVKDSGYKGHSEIPEFTQIQDLFRNKVIECPEGLVDVSGKLINGTGIPFENEFLSLHYGSASALGIYRSGNIEMIQDKTLFGWVNPLNSFQSFAMHALLASPDEIPLVIMSGPAGTAKTFLSLAAGLDKTYVSQRRKGMYRKVMISRPNIETDLGFGYLPGDLQDKMEPLLAPYYDNLEILLRGNTDEKEDEIQAHIDDLMTSGVIEICPLSFIRGRSITDSFIICDEAQNARRSLIRDVITRAGKNTKVIICGDPHQVDAPTLNERNNGLVYAIESMKNDSTTAIISDIPARASVRSNLAKVAIEKMK